MIRDVSESFVTTVFERVGRIAGRAQERRPLPTDVLESDDAYLVVFDAPDASAGDVRVRFSDSTVHVRIDRVRNHHDGFEMRFPGRGLALDGRAELPATVDPETATATLTTTGTLKVELPKVEEPTDEPIRISMDEEVGDDSDANDLDSRDALEGDDPDAYDDETDEEN